MILKISLKSTATPSTIYLNKLTGDGMDAGGHSAGGAAQDRRRPAGLRDPAKIKTWAFRIATNTAIDFIRRRDRDNTVFDESLINDADCGDDLERRQNQVP
jgi:hypothetical protein